MMNETSGYSEAIWWKSDTLGGWNRMGIFSSATVSSTSRVGSLCSFRPLRPISFTSWVSRRRILPASVSGSCLAKPMNRSGYFVTRSAISRFALS